MIPIVDTSFVPADSPKGIRLRKSIFDADGEDLTKKDLPMKKKATSMGQMYRKLGGAAGMQTLVITRLHLGELPSMGELKALIETRILRFPRFRSRIVWDDQDQDMFWLEVPAEELDWDYHLTSTDADITVESLEKEGLDSDYPLWRFALGHHGGAPAVFVVVDHCVGDGITIAEVLFSLCTEDDDSNLQPRPRSGSGLPTTRCMPCLSTMSFLKSAYWFFAPEKPNALRPTSGPAKEHYFAMSPHSLPLADVKAAKNCTQQFTVSHVLLASMVRAFRCLLAHVGDPAKQLKFAIAANLRESRFWEDPEKNFGNFAQAMVFPVTLGGEAPGDRFAVLQEVKQRLDTTVTGKMAAFLHKTLTPLGSKMTADQIKKQDMFNPKNASFTATVSLVVGPSKKVFLAGQGVDSVDFFVSSSLVQFYVGVISYAGQVKFTCATHPQIFDSAKMHVFSEAFNEEFYALKKEMEAPGSSKEAPTQPSFLRRLGTWVTSICA